MPAHLKHIKKPGELGGRLAGKSLPMQVLTLAVWPLMELALTSLVGLVDLALAGHLPDEPARLAATNAIGVAAFIGWLFAVIVNMVGTGATALIARAIGGGRNAVANAALGQALLLGTLMGAAAGVALFAMAPWIGMLIKQEGLALDNVVTYLRITMAFGPVTAIVMIGLACLRGAGDTRTPFVIMLIVNVVNIGVSVLLVRGPGALGGHGVAGIAWGTSIAWVLGAVLVLFVLGRGGVIRLRRKRLMPHKHTMSRILRVGVPTLIEQVGGTWLATFIVLYIVGHLEKQSGAPGMVGAHMIAIRIESLSFMPGMALSTAAATLVGQYLGLGDPDRAKRAGWLCFGYGAVVMGLMGIAFILVPEALAGLITQSPSQIEQARTLLMICGAVQIGFASYMILSGALRGAGDTKATMWITYACVYTVRVPGAFILGILCGLGLPGVWLALCGDLMAKGLVFGGRFAHGGWKDAKV